MAAEITRLQTEVTSAKNEKDSLTKSYEKLQQKAGHQVEPRIHNTHTILWCELCTVNIAPSYAVCYNCEE